MTTQTLQPCWIRALRKEGHNAPRTTSRHEVAARRRTQGPGGERDAGEDDRIQRRTDITDHLVGGCRCCVVEDRTGVGPLLEPGKPRDEQRHGAGYFPDAHDDQEVGGVAQVFDDLAHAWYSQDVPYSSHR